jgi:hypothetical protein
MRELTSILVGVAGLLLIATGLGWMFPPAGVIGLGAGFVIIGETIGRPPRRKRDQ